MSNLCDTTVFIGYLRGDAEISAYLNNQQPSCSIITAAELLQGVENKRDQLVVQKILRRVLVLPVTAVIGERMLGLIGSFHLSHGLAIPDGLIAATALAHNLTLVTHNVKHFSFLPGLAVRAWAELASEMRKTR